MNGAVRRIYSLEGRPVTNLDSLQDGQFYVAAGVDPFRLVPYNTENANREPIGVAKDASTSRFKSGRGWTGGSRMSLAGRGSTLSLSQGRSRNGRIVKLNESISSTRSAPAHHVTEKPLMSHTVRVLLAYSIRFKTHPNLDLISNIISI
jgi:hypothetical protein